MIKFTSSSKASHLSSHEVIEEANMYTTEVGLFEVLLLSAYKCTGVGYRSTSVYSKYITALRLITAKCKYNTVVDNSAIAPTVYQETTSS